MKPCVDAKRSSGWELYPSAAILRALRRYWWVLLIAAIGSATLSLTSAKLAPRVYVAEVWLKPNDNLLSPTAMLEKAAQLSEQPKTTGLKDFIQPLLERTIAIKLSGAEAQRVMKSVVENLDPDVYSNYERELQRFGDSAERGLEAWIAKYLRVERSGNEQFYRIRWHFFDKELVALQLGQFYERIVASENTALAQHQVTQVNALKQYIEKQRGDDRSQQQIADTLTSYLNTLSSLIDANYLSLVEPISKVEIRHSALYPERLPLLIMSALPLLILGFLIMKLLCHRETQRV